MAARILPAKYAPFGRGVPARRFSVPSYCSMDDPDGHGDERGADDARGHHPGGEVLPERAATAHRGGPPTDPVKTALKTISSMIGSRKVKTAACPSRKKRGQLDVGPRERQAQASDRRAPGRPSSRRHLRRRRGAGTRPRASGAPRTAPAARRPRRPPPTRRAAATTAVGVVVRTETVPSARWTSSAGRGGRREPASGPAARKRTVASAVDRPPSDAGGPTSTSRPPTMTPTRSARCSASSR